MVAKKIVKNSSAWKLNQSYQKKMNLPLNKSLIDHPWHPMSSGSCQMDKSYIQSNIWDQLRPAIELILDCFHFLGYFLLPRQIDFAICLFKPVHELWGMGIKVFNVLCVVRYNGFACRVRIVLPAVTEAIWGLVFTDNWLWGYLYWHIYHLQWKFEDLWVKVGHMENGPCAWMRENEPLWRKLANKKWLQSPLGKGSGEAQKSLR